jgi:hypothetical protein
MLYLITVFALTHGGIRVRRNRFVALRSSGGNAAGPHPGNFKPPPKVCQALEGLLNFGPKNLTLAIGENGNGKESTYQVRVEMGCATIDILALSPTRLEIERNQGDEATILYCAPLRLRHVDRQGISFFTSP